jgi:hypothetical protein
MAESSNCPVPTRRERLAGHIACQSALIGFIPLHLMWGFGVTLWTNEANFDEWYDDGGGIYLFVLSGMAALAGVFAMSLIQPWGTVFPRWVPLLAGRDVPRWPVIGLAGVLSVFLFLYTFWAIYASFFSDLNDDPSKEVFDGWILYYGIPQFLIWSISLMVAGWSYYRRTAERAARYRAVSAPRQTVDSQP